MKLNFISTGGVILCFSIQSMAGGITVEEISTTTETGSFPICSDGSGKLLPCANDIVIPPAPDSLVGRWSGSWTHDPRSTALDCYDADVTLYIKESNYVNRLGEIDTVVIRQTAGKVDIIQQIYNHYIESSGFVSNQLSPFGIYTDYILQFNDQGRAEGLWEQQGAQVDCYGTWVLTKD